MDRHPSFMRFDGRLWENWTFQKYLGWETYRIAHAPPSGGGEYRLALLDSAGHRLAETHPSVNFESGCAAPGTIRSARVTAYVPLVGEPAQLVFTHADRTLLHAAVADRAPELAQVHAERRETDRYLVQWKATSDGANALTYRVFYFVDKKFGFTIESRTSRSELDIDISTLPGSAHCQFGVLATDGLRSCSVVTAPFEVASRAPRVRIHTPDRNAVFAATAMISACGSSFDQFGRELPADDLVWTLDGTVTARSVRHIDLQDLEPGVHRLGLQLQASERLAAHDEVTISITPETPAERDWKRLFTAAGLGSSATPPVRSS